MPAVQNYTGMTPRAPNFASGYAAASTPEAPDPNDPYGGRDPFGDGWQAMAPGGDIDPYDPIGTGWQAMATGGDIDPYGLPQEIAGRGSLERADEVFDRPHQAPKKDGLFTPIEVPSHPYIPPAQPTLPDGTPDPRYTYDGQSGTWIIAVPPDGDYGPGAAPVDIGGSLAGASASAAEAKALGRGVLGGEIAPGGAGAGAQGDALDRAMAFASGPRANQGAAADNAAFLGGPRASDAAAGNVAGYATGPRAQEGTIGQLDAFLGQPEGPSQAQLQLDQASQGAMADVLSASRSGRSRDAGSQARQAAVAQGEIAGMGVDNARNAGLLRAQEADNFRKQQLAGLGQKGTLAQGVDAGTLEALGLGSTLAAGRDRDTLGALGLGGDLAMATDRDTLGGLTLGGDLATSARSAGVDERGQTLDFAKGLEGLGTGLEGDILASIPKIQDANTNVGRLAFDKTQGMTYRQKLKLASVGAAGDLLGEIIPW